MTVKKESSRPCVLPCRLFRIFLQPLRILSSLQTESKERFASHPRGGDVGFVQQHCHLMAKRMHDRLLAIDLNCFSLHMNWMSPSSSGSPHFSSSVEQSTTSGSRNKPLASLYSQSSGEGCFCTTATRTGGGKIQSQIEASSGRLTAAGIYVRSGRCCRGFPRWSRAA